MAQHLWISDSGWRGLRRDSIPAAEFATNTIYMDRVASANSPEWKKNVKIVISKRIAGDPWGSPQLPAKYFW